MVKSLEFFNSRPTQQNCIGFKRISVTLWIQSFLFSTDGIKYYFLNFLRNCRNITNFLFCVLWTCLVTSIKNENANLQKLKCLSTCKKWTPSMISFSRYRKDIANLLLWVIWEAWSRLSIMMVSPLKKLWRSTRWNQLLGNFDVYLHAKNQLHLSNFFYEIL